MHKHTNVMPVILRFQNSWFLGIPIPTGRARTPLTSNELAATSKIALAVLYDVLGQNGVKNI